MKILIITQYFWPENFRINDIAQAFSEESHSVEVLTGLPNYPKGSFFKGYSALGPYQDIFGNIKIHRSILLPRGSSSGIRLFMNYISFAITSSLKLLRLSGSYDIVFVFQPSPLTVAIPGYFAKKKFKIPAVIWCQDLWPDSVKDAGGINNPIVLYLLEKFSNWVYRNYDKILIQSELFKQRIQEQGGDKNKIHYLPNTIEDIFKPGPKKQREQLLNITYAGNIGTAQKLITLVKSVALIKDQVKLEIVIVGDGREKENLKQFISINGMDEIFRFVGQVSPFEVIKFYHQADILFLSLADKQTFNSVIPSKLQSYLACSKPILGSLNGEGKRIIEESNSGYCCSAENHEELAELIILMAGKDEDELYQMGVSGRMYFEDNYSRESVLKIINRVFKELSCPKS